MGFPDPCMDDVYARAVPGDPPVWTADIAFHVTVHLQRLWDTPAVAEGVLVRRPRGGAPFLASRPGATPFFLQRGTHHRCLTGTFFVSN
jgi:hypothetical protein